MLILKMCYRYKAISSMLKCPHLLRRSLQAAVWSTVLIWSTQSWSWKNKADKNMANTETEGKKQPTKSHERRSMLHHLYRTWHVSSTSPSGSNRRSRPQTDKLNFDHVHVHLSLYFLQQCLTVCFPPQLRMSVICHQGEKQLFVCNISGLELTRITENQSIWLTTK